MHALVPFFHQPDPQRPVCVMATPKKLIRRGPGAYFLVGAKRDGAEVEARLTAGRLDLRR